MKSIVTASDVSFEISNGRVLFSHLNFSLEPQLTALVGPNGIGKTTLAKLLSGELKPTTGKVHRNSAVIYFPQRESAPEITVNEYLAFEYHWSLFGEKLLDGIDREKLCSELSGGQWMRARLARTINEQFLILDEPTNDLDREGRKAVMDFLRHYPYGVLLISHDRECLQLCQNVLGLSNKGLSKFGGGWNAYEKAKHQERENLESQLATAKRERESAFAKRAEEKSRQEKRNRQGAEAAARGGLPKILLGARKRKAQATTGKIDTSTLQDAQDAVREAYEAFQDLKVDPVMYVDLAGSEIPSQKLVAEASGFNIFLGKWIYRSDLTFSWRGNIRLALNGPNGSGKSTLLKALTGRSYKSRGEMRIGSLKSLYLDQQCRILDDSKSIFENIREVSMASESEIRNNLAKFLFTKDSVFQSVSTLSGGERLRAALARGLMSSDKPELLILDEPTNNLDLMNIEFLENLVRQFQGALLIVSHDENFLENSGIKEEFYLPSL